ncbi:MAG: pyridoxal kinase PdxY [Pseudomonadota bacterium]
MTPSQSGVPKVGSPAIIVISSHVVRGSVGNRAAAFALEVLGHPVWSLPTIILPWHPGHGPANRIVADNSSFGAVIDDLSRAPWLGEVGAVLSGYLGDACQASDIARLVAAVKTANPAALYACDPVIGDHGGLYVPEATAVGIRDELISICDIATPNRFELQWLSGSDDFSANEALAVAARGLGPAIVLATSAFALMRNSIGSLLVTPDNAELAEHRYVADPPNGLGDLMSALFLSHIVNAGTGFEQQRQALARSAASVFEILQRTAAMHAHELVLEQSIQSIQQPASPVQMRKIAGI